MIVGLWIFLSVALVSVVLLYHWGHLRLTRKFFTYMLFFGVLSASLAVGAWRYYLTMADKPERQLKYADLALGMTPEEVLYSKGLPAYVGDYEKNPKLAVDAPIFSGKPGEIRGRELKEQPVRNRAKDYNFWQYGGFGQPTITAEFSPESHRLLAITCHGAITEGPSCPVLLDIADESSEQSVVEKLGAPRRETIIGYAKMLEYPDLNVFVLLARQKAFRITVKAPAN